MLYAPSTLERPVDAAHRHELPEPQVGQIERIVLAILVEARPDVDVVVDAVCLEELEVVWNERLRVPVLVVQRPTDDLIHQADAVLEALPVVVENPQLRIHRVAISGDRVRDLGVRRLAVIAR